MHRPGPLSRGGTWHLRLHGRGGEGVKLACRVVSRAAFLAGWNVQDSPLYGAERRGAPVLAFVRIAHGPIGERGYIERPDGVLVMDDSLLGFPDAAVLDGVGATTAVLVNSVHTGDVLRTRFGIPGQVAVLDVTEIALALLHRQVLSAPAAGFVVKAIGLAGWNQLAEAVRVELDEAGLPRSLVDQNLQATRRAFAIAPTLALAAPVPSNGGPVPVPAFVVPRLPARVASPAISTRATSALRSTEGWRVYRPVIDRERCTRCFFCFALCPEGAITLDAESYPVVDYAHCKGCLVCAHECPPGAIAEVREPPA